MASRAAATVTDTTETASVSAGRVDRRTMPRGATAGGYDFGGDKGEAIPIDQFVKEELARRKAWAEYPANLERQRHLLEGEQDRARRKRAERGDLIGPPNPYKPHRKS